MFPIVRMFASGQKAREVAEELRSAERLDTFLNREFRPFSPHVLDPAGAGAEGNRKVVRDAVDSGILPGGLARACVQGLERGNTVVVVRCSFGSSSEALEILEAAGPVDSDRIPELHYSAASLLSELLGIPMLSSNATPFSSFLGLPLLTEGPTVMGGSVNDFSFSRMLGLPMLAKGPGEWSLGLPVLSRKNPTPLSSTFGLPLLSKGPGDTGMGFPLLDRDNPTPLSSSLGLPLLVNEQDGKDAS